MSNNGLPPELALPWPTFAASYGQQLAASGVPEHFWPALHKKLIQIPAVSWTIIYCHNQYCTFISV